MARKRYLGDAVYADIDDRGLVLTTENGIRATNTIVLEPEVVGAATVHAGHASARRGRDQGGGNVTDERIRELADNLAEDLNGEVRDLWYHAEGEARAAEEIRKVIRRAVDEAITEERERVRTSLLELADEADHDGNRGSARAAREILAWLDRITPSRADASADDRPENEKAG